MQRKSNSQKTHQIVDAGLCRRSPMGVARVVVIGAFGMVFAGAAYAQGWNPQRNVEVIVPSTAGGSLDTTGRTVTRIWGELKLLPVSSSISNRPGGGHAVAYNYIAQRSGDQLLLWV